MKRLLFSRLLIFAGLCAACSSAEGTFSVAFQWAHGKPTFANPVYVFSRVVERDPSKPDVVLQLIGPVQYQGSAVSLPFNNVPNGSNRVVILELHETTSSDSQVEYYGLSEPFSIEAGQHKVIPVVLDVVAAPGLTGNNSIAVVCPTTQGYVSTEKVDLVLATDTGVSVKLANDLADLEGAPVQSLTGLPPPEGSSTGVVLPGWDLGVTSTASVCDVTTAATGCPRRVYAEFVDAQGYASPVLTTDVVLDEMPPTASATVSPMNAKAGDTLQFALVPDEALSSSSVAAVTPQDGQATIALSATEPYVYAVTSASPNGRFSAIFALIDLAGNRGTSASTQTFRIDTIVPTISAVTTDAAVYSEVSGHTQIKLTFDCPKDVGETGPTVSTTGLTATLSGRPMTCTYQSPTYTCLYTILTTTVGDVTSPTVDESGPQPIVLATLDESGNSDSYSTSVTFDFTPLILGGTIAPNPAKASDTPVLSVTADKPLSVGPTIVVTPTGALGTWTNAGVGTSWTFSFGQVPPVEGTFTLAATATDIVGHVGTIVPVVLTVNTIVPVISNVATDKPVYSEVSGFNVVTLTFDTPKAIDSTGDHLSATVGGHAMPCGTYQPQSPRYSCMYSVLGSEGTGTEAILINAADAAGNASSASTSVTFDFAKLTLGATMAPNPAKANDAPILALSASKALTTAPTLVITEGGTVSTALGNPTIGGAGTSWTFAFPAAVEPLAGTFVLTASAVDSVGHPATATPVSPFVVDAVVPTISNLATDAPIYSEVTGFALVTVTFDTPKSVDSSTGATLTATVGGQPLTCQPYQAMSPSYTCMYAITGMEVPGTQLVSVFAQDAVGNQSSQSTTVTFDFTPLDLEETITPNPTQAGGTPVLSVTSNKSLAAAPTITVTPAGTPIGSLGTPAVGGSTTAWTFTYDSFVPPLIGSFGIVATSQDSVGHTATTLSTTLVIDSLGPTITNVTTNATVFSEMPGFNQLQVTFNTTKSLDTAGSSLTATVGGAALSCGTFQQASSSYSCTLTVTQPLGGGTKIISIKAVDEAGNASSASTSVTFDFNPLTLSASLTPNPAKAAAVPLLSVTAGKSLTSAPVVMISGPAGGSLGTPVASGAGTAWSWSYPAVGSTTVTGTYSVTATAIDSVGHVGTAIVPTFVVDGTVPAISSVQTDAQTYSEVSGHNVVTLRFNVTKAVDQPGQLTVTLGGNAMSCGTWQATGPKNYTCTYIATIAGDTSGAQTIVINTADEAGNTASAVATVVFDFNALTLNQSLTPNPAKANATPVLTITLSKAISAAPTVSFSAVGTVTGSLGSGGPSTGVGTSWTYTFPTAVAPLAGKFNITSNAVDTVGHAASQTTLFNVDASIPVITNVGTNLTRYSAVSGFNTVQLSFNTTKNNQPTQMTTLSASLGGYCSTGLAACQPFVCGAFQSATPNYTCTYTVTGTETTPSGTAINTLAQGSVPVVIYASDEVGNQASGSASVTLDFLPPALSAAPAIEYFPAPNLFTGGSLAACTGSTNVLSSVTAATRCTQVRLSFVMTESLLANPTVTAANGVLAFQATTAAGVSYVFDGATTVAGTPPDASYGVTIAATDLVGNAATITPASPTFVIDTTAPAVPSSAAGGAITYSRTPWGSSASSGIPSYSVAGAAGAAEANGTVLIYDGPATTFDLIGQGAVQANGSFSAIPLVRTDRPAVYLATADEAGNESVAVAAHNVAWTASFNSKVPGNTLQNPHVLLADTFDLLTSSSPDLPPVGATFRGTLHPGSQTAPEAATYAGLTSGDSSPLVTTFQDGTWSITPPPVSPSVREGQATAYDSARGVSVLFGGSTSGGPGTTLNDTWEWNGTTWTQAIITTIPSARWGAAMAYDSARGVTVLFGGEDASSNFPADTWEWNGTIWKERTPVTSPPGREFHAMAYDSARGVTVLFSGENSVIETDTWEWNGTTWTQQTPATSPPGRFAFGMAYDSARRVTVLFAGQSASGTLADTWEWNGATWTQRTPASSPPARFFHALVYDSVRGVTVVFGGGAGSSALNDTWEWNGAAWTERTVNGAATSPPIRIGHGMAYDSARGVTVVFGGGSTAGLNDTWEWDGTTWKPRSSTTVPAGRSAQAMAYDSGHGVTLLFGGSTTGTNAVNDTWQWDGTMWTQLSPATSPGGRYQSALAYDSARGVTVLFGGDPGSDADLNDTWEWSGTTWTQRTLEGAAGSPPVRESHAMVYDSARGVTVLFGGYYGGSEKNDTWEWNGTSWTQRTLNGATGSPPVREYHSMAYDSTREVTVLFGGYNTAQGVLNDTWEWTGTSWTQRSPVASPSARYVAAMDYDSARGLSVLFGGTSGSGSLSETWVWNGTAWTQLFPLTSPAARAGGAMAYDSSHGVSVTFAGNYLDDTWLLSADPGNRPADLLEFDFAATGETFASVAIQEVAVRATAGGTGASAAVSGPVGAAVPGAVVAAWDFFTGGGWREWGANTATAAAPGVLTGAISSSWQLLHELYATDQTIDLGIFPAQATGNGTAAGAITLGDPELTVQYQHSESPCTVTSNSSCACAADETMCGSVCADLASDPQNCGGCGVTCTAGTTCVGSGCVCPGTEVPCNGVCTDRTLDPDNCGACGTSCGAYKSCSAALCSPCQAGQSLVGGSCATDIAVRSSTNQTGAAGTAQISMPAAVQVGDQLVVVTAPVTKGGATSTVSSGSGEAWSLVGLGVDAGQYLAIYTKIAHVADLNQNVTVTMNTVVAPITGESLNATLLDLYSQSGATISVDAVALRGAALGTSATAPAISTIAPNEVVLLVAAQAGATTSTLPAGTTALTRNGGFVTADYSLATPGPAATLSLTGGSSTASWEVAQVSFASSAH